MQTQSNQSFHRAIQEFEYPHRPSLKIPFLPVAFAIALFVFLAGWMENGIDRAYPLQVATESRPGPALVVVSSYTPAEQEADRDYEMDGFRAD